MVSETLDVCLVSAVLFTAVAAASSVLQGGGLHEACPPAALATQRCSTAYGAAPAEDLDAIVQPLVSAIQQVWTTRPGAVRQRSAAERASAAACECAGSLLMLFTLVMLQQTALPQRANGLLRCLSQS